MTRGSCLLSVADICLWIAILGSITALFAPFWVSSGSPPNHSEGLFMRCSYPYSESTCKFNTIDIQNSAKWVTACQGLWSGGTALLFVIGITSFFLCCDSCRRASCSGIVFVGIFIAAAALVSAVIIYGVKFSDSNVGFKRSGLYFDWGYYIAIVSAGTSLIATLLFGFVICCIRKE